jgi:O-antigen ligase
MTLIQFSRFFLYLSVFAVDIVLSSTFFPFIGGKYYFFRLVIELASIFLILSWAIEDQRSHIEERFRKMFRQPLFLAVSAFALMFLLASIFANDPAAAFWSNFERGEGGFQMIHYYAFFILLFVLLDTKDRWMTFMKTSLVAAGLMVFYGVGAAALWGSFVGPYVVEQSPTFLGRLFHPDIRFQGSLGNPAYVAPYLMFAMFFAALLWLWGKRGRIQTVLLVLTEIIFLIFFTLSQTRGAFIGLAAAMMAFFGYMVWVQRGRFRQITLLVLAAMLVVGGILFVNRESPAIKRLPGSRLLTINIKDLTAQTRLWTWRTAWEGFKERPILGWGPENFSTVFDRHFDTRHYVPGENRETWFDRAHSVAFDYLAETGILGFLAYASIFAVYYYYFFRHHRSLKNEWIPEKGRTFFHGLLLVIPVGYLVQGLFLFDVLPIFLNWIIVLAFVAKLYEFQHGPVRS